MNDAANRQTGYVSAERFTNPEVLPLPTPTTDLDQAKADLTETGMCFIPDVLSDVRVRELRDQLSAQAAAEQALGELASTGANDRKQIVSNRASQTGNPRRNIAVYCCLPWMRQQENWGVTCLQEVLDDASPKLKARLGLRTYGTLGGMNGASRRDTERTLGNADVIIPDYVIGEGAELHPMSRVSKN